MQDDLGDRMKAYEAAQTSFKFDGFMPVYARLDGRGFSKFTRGMRRPYDERMSMAMITTASALVKETNARIAYTQSDEISLVWLADAEKAESQIFFDGKMLKLASVLASFATAAFLELYCRRQTRNFVAISIECRISMRGYFSFRQPSKQPTRFYGERKMPAATPFRWWRMTSSRISACMALARRKRLRCLKQKV